MHTLAKAMLLSGFAAATLAAMPAIAQTYPAKPVRLITGNPGATADILARQIGRRLAERWGQQVIVDNRGGAAGMIAAELTAKANPDGYTLLMGQLNSHALAPNMHRKLAYDPVADFAPITLVASAPQVLVTVASLPVGNWREFAEYARRRPGELLYASAGHGTASHLTSEFLMQAAKLQLVHVNYKGGASATLAVVGGEAQAAFVPLATALPMSQSAKLRLLAIAGVRRFPSMPNLPTLHELGLKNFEAASWFGMFAPARTPNDLIIQLNREIVDILRVPVVAQDVLNLGAETAPTTPAEFSEFLRMEIEKWRKVVQQAGVLPQ